MATRDSQTVILSRQAILLVTAVGVGLLTLCYVLGVQVGKQSAALRQTLAQGTGEELRSLPAPVADQLKVLEATAPAPAPAEPPPAESPAAPADDKKGEASGEGGAGKAEGKAEAKAESEKPGKDAKDKKKEAARAPAEPRWTLQLVSTPDAAEAQRMAARAQAAGFKTTTVTDKGLLKVRLQQAGPRESVDATAHRLKNRGFKPFAVKVD
jgi:cell division protein FtsN